MRIELAPDAAFGRSLPPGARHAIHVVVILAALALSTAVVYGTGGAGGAYTYVMLIPILLAAHIYGIAGGLMAGVIAPLLIGPWMPLDVALGAEQPLEHWLVRGGMFALVGTIAGVLYTYLHHRARAQVQAAREDPETGLLNQGALKDDLDARMADSREARRRFGVVLVRATDLADVMDVVGIEGGDIAMRELAHNIEHSGPAFGRPYRFGGGELGLILEIAADTDLMRIARQVHEAASRPFEIDGAPVRIEPTIGVGHTAGETHADARELVRRARVALRRAVMLDRNWVNYEPALDADTGQTVKLIAQAETALAAGEFELHYQPKIRMSDRKPAGAEALIRWYRADTGYVPPGTFLPKLEQTSLIEPFSRFVIHDAVDFVRAGVMVPVSINLAPRNLTNADAVNALLDALHKTGTPGSAIQAEVTESGLMRDPDTAIDLLTRLRDYGIGVSIDDFGTGYASFSYLRRLPATELKIDRSFIRPLEGDERARRLVLAMVEAGHALGLTVTAEGIETEAQASIVTELGCDLGQGFLWSPALPAQDLRHWLDARAVPVP